MTKEKQAAVTATVVIDAGHGGSDPGKIGINGAREKEVNLAIAEELKACLEEAGTPSAIVDSMPSFSKEREATEPGSEPT